MMLLRDNERYEKEVDEGRSAVSGEEVCHILGLPLPVAIPLVACHSRAAQASEIPIAVAVVECT